ncbi:unnamed protein product [Nyctereutes procyonoides]|uniref:(raccoon dog) hypothetical protein n=1 Tax=Nyctereutes procyonoides TaxID=34880 RepID=A0A811YMU2_NYCPR|nr:unnamed protein product [Nyctereutes procyonoides]
MTSMDILEHFEENCCVMRYITAGQFRNIISPQEFVGFSYTMGYKDVGFCPTRFIRGFNHPCGWFCGPRKDNCQQSLLMGHIQMDLCGMILQSAANTAMASTLISFYAHLGKALQKVLHVETRRTAVPPNQLSLSAAWPVKIILSSLLSCRKP